jgi:hypothetical protein
MILIENLIIGTPYFIYSFFDRSGKLPNIRTVVYIGKDIEIEGYSFAKEEYFFQDPATFSEYGVLLTHNLPDVDNNVIAVSEQDLFSFYDCDGLIEELKKFAAGDDPFAVAGDA